MEGEEVGGGRSRVGGSWGKSRAGQGREEGRRENGAKVS